MPAHTAEVTSGQNALTAERATSIRDAGIRRSCSRRHSPDRIIERSNEDFASLERTPSAEVDLALSAHEGTDIQHQTATSSEKDCALPNGCAMGVPVARGTGVTVVPEVPITVDLAIMRSIQADNYKFIRHMIMAGWTPTNPSACSFSITINRDGALEVWNVSEATPLHYAVCSGSLKAAAALVIAFPELAGLACKVETASDRMPEESMWTTLDLTSFFGKLYLALDQERQIAYQQASLILLHLRQDPSRLPFLQMATPAERLTCAGKNASAVTKALSDATGC